MTLLQKLSLAVTIGSTTFSVAASIPNPKTILPDNVVLCEPNAGCINQTLFGREYKVLSTPRFTVMVSISHQGPYTRADVSITNNTDTPLSLTPEDFRVEVITPKPKVLLYVPPANLVLPPPPLPPAPPAAPQSTPPNRQRLRISIFGTLRNRYGSQPSPTHHRNRSSRRRGKREGLAGSRRQSCCRQRSIGDLDRAQRSHSRTSLLRARQEISPRQRRPAHRWSRLRVPLCHETLTSMRVVT